MKLIILYDNWCPKCTSFAKLISKLDWLHLIDCRELRNIEEHSLDEQGLNILLAKQQMASFTDKWQYGFTSIYLIFLRLPAFWIFLPAIILLKLTGLGQLLYKNFAVNRKIIPLYCDTYCKKEA